MTNFNALQADAPDERVWEPIKVADMNDDEFSSFIRLMIEGATNTKAFFAKLKPQYTTNSPRPLPSQQVLKNLFDYDALTGNLIWKSDIESSPIKAGTVAGGVKSGYVSIKTGGITYRAHRLVYGWHFGEIPNGMQIDHIDNDKTNNRIENLRLCRNAENGCNRPVQSNNPGGLKGAHKHSNGRQWEASITTGRTKHTLGLYDTKEMAHRAYAAAARSIHGDFLHHSLQSVEPLPRDHKVWDKIARIPGAILPPDADPRQLSLLPDELRAHKKMPSETITGHLSLQSKPNTNLQTLVTRQSDSFLCSPHLHKEELSNESAQF